MATTATAATTAKLVMGTLEMSAIRDYLVKVGCKVEYPVLVNAFKKHLYNADPKIQGEIRTKFKDYVNRLATVRVENNMKFIILRPEFRTKMQRSWNLEACNCNYGNLVKLLKEEPELAHSKDIFNGYTALHWAAKFGNLDIVELLAGTYGVSPDIKSRAGYTPLHIACMFNNTEVASLLLQKYRARADIRDHGGKFARQYLTMN